jgi:diguanylate cyclase (GGDEF)-like protein
MLTYVDVTDLVRHADQLDHLASTDGLTDLPNRRQFFARAEDEWNRFQRYHRPLTLLMIDVDNFKSLNDRFGHSSGDRALQHFAALCKANTRSTDLVARIGGEEFAVLLPETDLGSARELAERLRVGIAEKPFTTIGGAETVITVSIGVAQASVSMSGFTRLMKLADDALYAAKANGRNRAMVSDDTPGVQLRLAAE